jgi:hypothetical protein
VLGLGWYDFGARMLDPATGRWFVPDSEAERYPDATPYGFVLGNPIRYHEHGGRDVVQSPEVLGRADEATGTVDALAGPISQAVRTSLSVLGTLVGRSPDVRSTKPRRTDTDNPDVADGERKIATASAAGTPGILIRLRNWLGRSNKAGRAFAKLLETGMPLNEGGSGGKMKVGYDAAGQSVALTEKQTLEKYAGTRPSRPRGTGPKAQVGLGGLLGALNLIQGLMSDYEVYQRAQESGRTFSDQSVIELKESIGAGRPVVFWPLPIPMTLPQEWGTRFE